MSDQTPGDNPNTPKKDYTVFDISGLPTAEDIKKKANEARDNAPPQVQQAVEKASGVFVKYKQEIAIVLLSLLFLRIYKRRVSRAAVVKTLKTLEAAGKVNSSNLQTILEELRAYPGQAVVDPSNGMVHLLKGKDTIVTVFGDFDRMDTEELWNTVANILNLNVTIDPRIAR